MQKKVKIKIVCPWWSRVEVVAYHCRSMKKFIKEAPYDLTYLAILSKEDPDYRELLDMAFAYDFEVCIYKNLPISEKLNAGITLALEDKPDYIMNMGSDDLCDKSIWPVYKQLIAAKNKFFGIDSCHIIDLYSKEAYYLDLYNEKFPVGVLRMIHREAIETLWNEWYLKLYPSGVDRGMDTASMKRLEKFKIKPTVVHTEGRAFTTGLKCNTSINHFLHLSTHECAKPIDYNSIKHLIV